MSKKKIALIELHYLPPISYFYLFQNFEEVQIEACENYQKNSFRNRCLIATANGVHTLSVPLRKGKNAQQNIREVQIANETDWQRQTWENLKTAYGSSPYWIFYADRFEAHFKKTYTHLFDFNFDLLQTVLSILKKEIITEVSLSETYIPKTKLESVAKKISDFRNTITPKNYFEHEIKKYPQVFSDRIGYVPNLSVLDAIFCRNSIS